VKGNAASTGFYIQSDVNKDAYVWQAENRGMYIGTNNSTRMTINTSGNVGIGTTSPAQVLSVNSDSVQIITAQSPASGAACDAGEIAWDTSYIYVCTASGAWKRAALTGGY
jgi:hypothetical protein